MLTHYERKLRGTTMAKEKSSRNKTIDLTVEDGKEYLDRCINVGTPQSSVDGVLNKTILGNTFDVMPLLPRNSVDLVIADPPYNLTKAFNGTTFSKKTVADYEEYTRRIVIALFLPQKSSSTSSIACCLALFSAFVYLLASPKISMLSIIET